MVTITEEINSTEYPTLLAIWESSVRATHHFLSEQDILFFKNVIQEKDIFSLVKLFSARDGDNRILGFMGINGETLEMIFIHPDYIGKGIGQKFLHCAIEEFKVRKVEVNEQNNSALQFYLRFGFQIVSRSELDGMGKPFPILHLEI